MKANSKIEKIPVPCPVCDQTQCTVKYRPSVRVDNPKSLYGAASGIQGTQTLVSCNSCATLYENPRYPEDVILAGYAESEDSGHDSQHASRIKSFYSALESLKNILPAPGAKVLDVGAAGGAFLEAATSFGYQAQGIEPSAHLVQQSKARGLSIEQGTVAEALQKSTLTPESFDLVCFWDVLEHVANPKELLRDCHQLLLPQGLLLINYPDIGTWQARLAGKRFWWLISVHLLHFSRNNIKVIAAETGFEVLCFKPYWQTLQFGYLQKMALHYAIPGAAVFERLTPQIIKNIPVPYYASQTTALLRKI